jgi:hypothetical protein
MRWNVRAWDRILATDGGRLAHRNALISVARQNSKTTAMEALVGWWCTDGTTDVFKDPQTVAWLSHDLKLTEQAFVAIARMLDTRVVASSYSFGRQRLRFDTGSELVVQSNTAGAGHGLSLDLCIIDEAWRVKPEVVNHGIRPAMRARPTPLLVMTSTAGDYDSTLLRQWREQAMTETETGAAPTLAFLEWSPPPGADINQPKWWAWANPCLGTTLTPQTLLSEYQGPDRNAFLRGSLNVWVAAAESWLPPGQWEACKHPRFPDLAGGVVVVEMSQGGDRFVALRAENRSGVVYVTPLAVTTTADALWDACSAVYGEIDRLAVGITLDRFLPPEMARKRVLVGIRELARSVPMARAMIAAGQIAHPGSPILDEHVARAVASMQAGLSTAHSSGPIELARCLVWAAQLVARPAAPRRPAVAAARERKQVAGRR